jgi:hypothetical protein
MARLNSGVIVVAAILIFASIVALGRVLSRRSTDPSYPATTRSVK